MEQNFIIVLFYIFPMTKAIQYFKYTCNTLRNIGFTSQFQYLFKSYKEVTCITD